MPVTAARDPADRAPASAWRWAGRVLAAAAVVVLLTCGGAGWLTLRRVQSFRGLGTDPKGLLTAVRAGDVDRVTALLDAGVDPNARTRTVLAFGGSWDDSPLHAAAERGDAGLLTLLLGAGGDPDLRRTGPRGAETEPTGETPLAPAVSGGHTAAVRVLLDAGADPNVPGRPGPDHGPALLSAAAARGDAEMVRLLLDRGAAYPVLVRSDVGDSALVQAASRARRGTTDFTAAGPVAVPPTAEDRAVFDLLLARHPGGTAPGPAYVFGDGATHPPTATAAGPLRRFAGSEERGPWPDVLADLVALGVNPDEGGGREDFGPLFAAVKAGRGRKAPAALDVLLAAGADPDAADRDTGRVPLCFVPRFRAGTVVPKLVAAGADPDGAAGATPPPADTPLTVTLRGRTFTREVAEALHAAGARVDGAAVRGGHTPLLVACGADASGANADAVDWLLARGADPNRANAEIGDTPLAVAAGRDFGADPAVTVLLARGADPTPAAEDAARAAGNDAAARLIAAARRDRDPAGPAGRGN